MKKIYTPHHHYKGEMLTPAEKVERAIVETLLISPIPDEKRENSIAFELKHSSGCIQIARILAQQRGLNLEIAEVASGLHDMYVMVTGIYKNHAVLGGPLAEELLRKTGGFSEQDIKTIREAIIHHSEKHLYSKNPYVELVKDTDVFDCSLYKGAEGDYRINKSPKLFRVYVKRIKKVRKELNLNPDTLWR